MAPSPNSLFDTLHRVAAALFDLGLWAALIELAGALVVTRVVVVATVTLLRRGNAVGTLARARLVVAQGVLLALNFTLAATLLQALQVHTWLQILTFAVIVALRLGMRRVFIWEQRRSLAPP